MNPLRIVSAGAAQALVGTIAAREAISVEGEFGAVGAMLERFRSGVPCDVVILTRAQVAALVAENEAHGKSAADLGTVATSIAVRAGDPAPNVADGDSLRAALLASDAIFLPDILKSTAGKHFAQVLEQLGIRPAIEARLKTFANGAAAMRAMAGASGHPIGCTQATEILATPGIRLVAPLPNGFGLATVYSAAVAARASDAATARRFVAALAGDSSRVERAKAGFA